MKIKLLLQRVTHIFTNINGKTIVCGGGGDNDVRVTYYTISCAICYGFVFTILFYAMTDGVDANLNTM